MAQKPSISKADSIEFLQQKFGTEITDLVLLSGGEWSQAYSFISNGQKYVLRWSNTIENFERDALATSFSNDAMPIPKVVDRYPKI